MYDEEWGDSKGGRGEGSTKNMPSNDNEYVYCRCPQCFGGNYFVVVRAKPRAYSKCQHCGEVIPTGSYRLLMRSNTPLPVPRKGNVVV